MVCLTLTQNCTILKICPFIIFNVSCQNSVWPPRPRPFGNIADVYRMCNVFQIDIVPPFVCSSTAEISNVKFRIWYWYFGGIHKYINKTISFLTQAYSASVFIFLVKIVLVKAKQCKRVISAYFFVEDEAQTDEGAAPPDVPVSGDQDQVCVSTFFFILLKGNFSYI